MYGKLRGKKALITGASKGIGRAIAEELSFYGVKVALLARSKDKLDDVVDGIARSGNKALALKSDLRDENSILSAIVKYKEQFGSLDFLINNAGVYLLTPVDSATENDWDKQIDTTLKAPFFCSQAICVSVTSPAPPSRIARIVGASNPDDVNSNPSPTTGEGVTPSPRL